MNPWLRRALWLIVLIAIGFAFHRAFEPAPVLVDVATIERGELVVTVDDDGRTRVRDRYTISAPRDGMLLRPPLEAGAEVRAGETVLAELAPRAVTPFDARARADAKARIARAEASLERARETRARAEADEAYARGDHERRAQLLADGSEARDVVERAARDAARAASDLRAASFTIRIAEYELEQARSALIEDGADENARATALRSPIDGKVIRVFEESTRSLTAGAPILEVGDTGALEIIADYLSEDAVQIEAGMQVIVEGWGGDEALAGVVRLVEPGGFTKISALGVEEQRVNVVIDPLPPLEPWARLQDGYRVELRVVTARSADVVRVPTGALFRNGEDWAVFTVQDGLAKSRAVQLGQRAGLDAEVESGLEPGEVVILYPSELIDEGAVVEVR